MKFTGELPNNWTPRWYQVPVLKYLLTPGTHKHAELIWHRRTGKDDVCLQFTNLAIHLAAKAAPYWHMLPEATQARKAIWDAVDPHTGVRRIDWAFPRELRATTRDKEMMIIFKTGATWQVVGSDNYNSLVGSTLGGVVFSEWPIANPAARGFIRPILRETGGFQLYVGTPRGRNHAHTSFEAARADPNSFSELLTVDDTKMFTKAELEDELKEYVSIYGEDVGQAFFEQEYYCSFDVARVGAVYGAEIRKIKTSGRLMYFPIDPNLPVHIACDLGYRDASAFWYFQVSREGPRLIDHAEGRLLAIEDYNTLLRNRNYNLSGTIFCPHDAKARSLQTGRSIEEQLRSLGWNPRIVPMLSKMDGISAVRKTLQTVLVHPHAAAGLELLADYRFEWDEKLRVFKPEPVHDYASHTADALRYMALAWRMLKDEPIEASAPMKGGFQMTINDLMKRHARERKNGGKRHR